MPQQNLIRILIKLPTFTLVMGHLSNNSPITHSLVHHQQTTGHPSVVLSLFSGSAKARVTPTPMSEFFAQFASPKICQHPSPSHTYFILVPVFSLGCCRTLDQPTPNSIYLRAEISHGQLSQTLQVLFFPYGPPARGKIPGIKMNQANSCHETPDWWTIPGGLSRMAAETVATIGNQKSVFVQLTTFLRHQSGIEILSLSISWVIKSHPTRGYQQWVMARSSQSFMPPPGIYLIVASRGETCFSFSICPVKLNVTGEHPTWGQKGQIQILKYEGLTY